MTVETVNTSAPTPLNVADQINAILGEAMASGKTVTVTGEEERHYFCRAEDHGAEVSITYSPKKTSVIKKGSYSAEISKLKARSLLRNLESNMQSFRCVDTDGEPLSIQVS